jgi:hypothetical protein
MADTPPPLTTLDGPRTAGIPDPAAKIHVDIAGRQFDAGNRTAAHMRWTLQRLAKKHPDARVHIAKGCYVVIPPGHDDPSAGTHDGDGVLDLEFTGIEYPAAEKFMRKHGWAAWWRHTGEWKLPENFHVHAVSLGCPGQVGGFVPGQVSDYHNHALGLKDQHTAGNDPTWHPKDISKTVFDYPRWLKKQAKKAAKAEHDQ